MNSLILAVLVSSMFAVIPVKAKQLKLVRTQLGEKYICAQKALNAAYANLGYELVYQTLPSKRGLLESNNGRYDGEMLRVENINEQYANLIPVPVVLCYVRSVLLARAYVDINNYDDLKKYRFGITSGYVGLERIVEENNIPVVRATKYQTLLEMLKKERIEVTLINETTANAFLKTQPAGEFIIIDSFERSIKLYHYLHKKHEDLVPLITKELELLSDKNFIAIPNKD